MLIETPDLRVYDDGTILLNRPDSDFKTLSILQAIRALEECGPNSPTPAKTRQAVLEDLARAMDQGFQQWSWECQESIRYGKYLASAKAEVAIQRGFNSEACDEIRYQEEQIQVLARKLAAASAFAAAAFGALTFQLIEALPL